MSAVPLGFSPGALEGATPSDLEPLVALAAPLYDDTSQSTGTGSTEHPASTSTTGLDLSTSLDFASTFDFGSFEQASTLSALGVSPPDYASIYSWRADLDLTYSELDMSAPFDYHPSAAQAFEAALAAAVAFDTMLDSPLGLGTSIDDTPYSEYLHSPMFDDYDGIPDLDAMPSLFGSPAAFSSFPTPAPIPAPLHLLSSSRTTFPPTPSVPYLPSPSTSIIASPRPTKPLRKTSTARASPAVIDLATPIAPRTYLLPSATSRKRKPSFAERELAKRQCVPTDTGEHEADLPEDLVAAVERHRAMNTASARKSRQRKKQQMQELEAENQRLVAETTALKATVAQLEGMLRSLVGLPTA